MMHVCLPFNTAYRYSIFIQHWYPSRCDHCYQPSRRWLSKLTDRNLQATLQGLRTQQPHRWIMSTTGEVPVFFKNMGSGSPMPRQKFCGMFCPVEGSGDSKTLDFQSLPGGSRKIDGQVIDRQTDISQPRVEIRESRGKSALQNLDDRVRATDFCALSPWMKWNKINVLLSFFYICMSVWLSQINLK